MSTLFRCVIVAMPAVWGLPAQQPAAALKESLARNQAALKQHTWTETTQASVKGEGQPNALVIRNYAKPDDQVTLAFDAAAKKIRNYNLASYLDKPDETVDLAVSFDTLADEANYAKEVLVNARSKHIQVRVTNSGRQKAGS